MTEQVRARQIKSEKERGCEIGKRERERASSNLEQIVQQCSTP